MKRFDPKSFQGLVSNPPQTQAALTDERMRDEIASIQALNKAKIRLKTDIDLGLTEEESGDG